MKKIYLMATLLGASTLAFGQVQQLPVKMTKTTEKAGVTHLFPKAEGETIWSSDFSDATQWAIGGDGEQGSWEIGTEADIESTTPQGSYVQLLPDASSKDNGFAFFESIKYLLGATQGSVKKQNAWITTTTSLDLSEHEVVTVTFMQGYRAFNHDMTLIEASLDGGATWPTSLSQEVNTEVATNTSSSEPVIRVNFTVSNSDDVKFRFRWNSEPDDMTTAHQYGAGYGWLVDDFEVIGLSDYDLSTRTHSYGTDVEEERFMPYFQIPLEQVSGIESRVTIENEGSSTLNDVTFTATEASAEYTSSSTPTTLAFGDTVTVEVNEPFVPSAIGSYSIEYEVTSDQEDDVPGNNQMAPYNFQVTEYIYARDSSTQAENGVVYQSLCQDCVSGGKVTSFAVYYEINQTTEVTGISFQIGDEEITPVDDGSKIFGQLLNEEAELMQGATTEEYDVSMGDEGKYITLAFANPVVLTPGGYYASVELLSDNISIAAAGRTRVLGTSLGGTADGWFNLIGGSPVYIIRMNFDPTVNIVENAMAELELTQFPNPFANESTVNFSLQESADVSYTIVDLAGQVIADVKEGTLMAGEHQITINGASLANGVYYLNLKAGNTEVTHKMVVNK